MGLRRILPVFLGLIIIVLVVLALVFVYMRLRKKPSQVETGSKIEGGQQVNSSMKITSSAFDNNQMMPSKYTCDGENISPPLEITQIPEKAKSLVLIVDDPDAPSGDWVHWLVWNIEPSTGEIGEKQIPSGATAGTNDFGKQAYGGPCPPSGTHRYQFKLYALDTNLDISASSKKIDLENSMQGHILDSDVLVGLYKRGD